MVDINQMMVKYSMVEISRVPIFILTFLHMFYLFVGEPIAVLMNTVSTSWDFCDGKFAQSRFSAFLAAMQRLADK